jgi:hypothetical protein
MRQMIVFERDVRLIAPTPSQPSARISVSHQMSKETEGVDKEVLMLRISTQMGCLWLFQNPNPNPEMATKILIHQTIYRSDWNQLVRLALSEAVHGLHHLYGQALSS